jgi:hypothetical protein
MTSKQLQLNGVKKRTKKQQTQIEVLQAAIIKLEQGQKKIIKKQTGTNKILFSYFRCVLKLLKTLTGPRTSRRPRAPSEPIDDG